jgi:ATP-dependent Lhr-like helicase
MKEKFIKKLTKKEIVKFIQEHLYFDEHSAGVVYDYFNEQFRFSEIPDQKLITIERFKAEKNYVVVNSMYGRRVNDALSRALAWIMGSYGNRDIEMGINDNGFYFAGESLNIEKAFKELNPENFKAMLEEAIERTDILARRFRHCATRSLMILRNYKGKSKSVGKQQVKSHFLLAAVRKISKDFPILREARREVLEDLMDINNTKLVLEAIKQGKLGVKVLEVKMPSPFSINLILQGHSDLLRVEDKQDFLKRMHQMHLKEIEGKTN